MHPGGANFLFADGSVKFLKASVSRSTYAALGSRAGGEVISADQY
jgi:prepilin-type processing-associated H-X9-DG protein